MRGARDEHTLAPSMRTGLFRVAFVYANGTRCGREWTYKPTYMRSLTTNSFVTTLEICRVRALRCLPTSQVRRTWHTFRSEVTAAGELVTAVRTIGSTRRRSLA